MHRHFRLLGAAALAACTGAANADATISVDVTDFRVVLTSLAVGGDGPLVAFNGPGASDAFAAGYVDSGTAVTLAQNSGSGAFDAVGASALGDRLAGGATSLAGDVFGLGAVASASAYASSQATWTVGESQLGLVNDVEASTFALSPHTRMTISADVSVRAGSTGTLSTEYASGHAFLWIGDEGLGGPQGDIEEFGGRADPTARSSLTTGSISVSYVNDTDATLFGGLSGGIQLYAQSGGNTVSAVPEPASLPLLLAGLAATAAVSRRRRPR